MPTPPINPIGRALAVLLLGASAPASASTTHYRNILDVDPDEPEYLCNDGTVPLFYVRKGNTHPNRWVIYTEGGSSCQSPDDCEDRWLVDTRKKMGSGCFFSNAGTVTCGQNIGAFSRTPGAPVGGYATPPGPTKSLDGIFKQGEARNPFAGWTKVYMDYCSSDTWAGQGGVLPTEDDGPTYPTYFEQFDVTLDPLDPLAGWPPPWGSLDPWLTGEFTNVWIDSQPGSTWTSPTHAWTFGVDAIFFNGHNIVERMFDQLSSGTLVSGNTGVDPSLTITNATHLVIAGSSAGGVGARVNLDYLADRLEAVAPGATSVGIIEAAYSGGQTEPVTGEADVWPRLSPTIVGDLHGSANRTVIWSQFIDESCATRTGATATLPYLFDQAYVNCGGFSQVVAFDDLETPYFARHALWDRVTRPDAGADGDSSPDARKRAQQQIIEYGGWHLTQESQIEGYYFDCDPIHVQLVQPAFYNEALDSSGLIGSTDTWATTVDRWLNPPSGSVGPSGTRRASMACNP